MNSTSATNDFIDYKNTLNLPKTNFPMKGDGPRREVEFQKFWFESNIYKKALENRKKSKLGGFLLHDGPPYLSSSSIHIGTALNKILKDIVVKYKTLKGYYSPYLPGFDCHGLPIELTVLKENKIISDSLENISVNVPLEIRNACKAFVLRNKKSQEDKFKRLGVLGDWENAYMTIDPKFEAAQLKLFREMVNRGYIYRGLKPVFWCSTCATALAEAEVEYVENHKSPSIYVTFNVVKLSDAAKKLERYKDLKVVIWTTTPWTIPGNLAICLNEFFEYVIVFSKQFGHLLIAEKLLQDFNNKIEEECTLLCKLKGRDFEGTTCKHPLYDHEIPIILGEHVTLEAGTGCVHTAPGHGLEDFFIGQKYGLKVLSPVDAKGLFTSDAGTDLQGLYVHEAGNKKVIELLSQNKALIKHEEYYHSYPHCWRSKTPIIFRATEQWFCSVEKFRAAALKEIDNVVWIPSAGRNRIYSMVETRTDWCISRQRVWGVPIPALYCDSCNKIHLNSQVIDEFVKILESKGSNVWWELDLKDFLPHGYKCECGNNSFKKETDTMDVWFDSGSTHFAVVDQSNELKAIKSVMYLEGSDQHRGWFQSSLLTSVAIKGKAPYKYVLTHGFVLDESGRKMSKSLGNIVDPEKVISVFGADILRLWVASTDYSSDMRIGQNMLGQLAEVYRNIRNTARFILGNLYDFKLSKNIIQYDDLWDIDKYLLHKLEILKEQVTQSFEDYEFYKYYQLLQNFCAVDLSSFYFDLNKDRLYTAGKYSISRRSVQTVLCEVLHVLVRILCPVLPHLAEDIWKHLPSGIDRNVDSVICLDWPLFNTDFKNNVLAASFEKLLLVKEVVYKALEIARQNKKIGKSVESKLYVYPKKEAIFQSLKNNENELPTIFIVSQVSVEPLASKPKNNINELARTESNEVLVVVTTADGERCPRCWKYSLDIGGNLKHKTICLACTKAVEECCK